MTLSASGGEATVVDIYGVGSTPSLPILPGQLWPRVVVPVRISTMGQINLFKNYLNSIEPCEENKTNQPTKQTNKKNLIGNNTKNVNMNVQQTWFPNLKIQYYRRWVDMSLKSINQSIGVFIFCTNAWMCYYYHSLWPEDLWRRSDIIHGVVVRIFQSNEVLAPWYWKICPPWREVLDAFFFFYVYE